MQNWKYEYIMLLHGPDLLKIIYPQSKIPRKLFYELYPAAAAAAALSTGALLTQMHTV